MFTRRLKALGYPGAEQFRADFVMVKELVNWLEDNKIRFLPTDSRGSLKAADFKEFKRAFNNYISGLGCPYGLKDINPVLTWLLGRAVRSEYTEVLQEFPELNTGEFRGARALRAAQTETESTGGYKLPLPSADLPEFTLMVSELCDFLKIPPHDNHILRLQAAAYLVTERGKVNSGTPDLSRKPIGLTPKDLGFDLGHSGLDQAAMGLRLLHQSELRNLQTRINEIIVKVQSITADPRTDERLGRVGK